MPDQKPILWGRPRKLTPAGERAVARAFAKGTALKAIAHQFHISIPLVSKLAREAGLPLRPRGAKRVQIGGPA